MNKTVFSLLACLALGSATAQTAEQVVKGQDGWLLFTDDWRDQVWSSDFQTIINLRDISRAFAQKDIRVIFTLTPTKVDIFPEYLPKNYPKLPSAFYTRYNDLIKLFQVADLPIVDTKAPLLVQKNAHPEQPLWMMRDTHWKPLGAYVAGQAIGKEIVRRGWIKDLKPQKMEVVWKGQLYNTDLGRLVPTADSKVYPLVENVDAPTLNIKDVGLLDQNEPPITLIGSSYGQLPFPGLHIGIAISSGQEVVNNAVSGGSLWGGLTDYLKNAPQRAKPRVIVWELPVRLFDDYQPKISVQSIIGQIDKLPWK